MMLAAVAMLLALSWGGRTYDWLSWQIASLFAASLMLSEGLGEHAAGRTLERAVSTALASGVRTADLGGSGPAAAGDRRCRLPGSQA